MSAKIAESIIAFRSVTKSRHGGRNPGGPGPQELPDAGAFSVLILCA